MEQSRKEEQNHDKEPFFELPMGTPEEDIIVLQNILIVLQSLGAERANPPCVGYKVQHNEKGFYMLRCILPASDIFEIDMDDMMFVKSVCPARIEKMAFTRSIQGGTNELVIKVLDCRQRLMITSTVSFSSATRKRAWSSICNNGGNNTNNNNNNNYNKKICAANGHVVMDQRPRKGEDF